MKRKVLKIRHETTTPYVWLYWTIIKIFECCVFLNNSNAYAHYRYVDRRPRKHTQKIPFFLWVFKNSFRVHFIGIFLSLFGWKNCFFYFLFGLSFPTCPSLILVSYYLVSDFYFFLFKIFGFFISSCLLSLHHFLFLVFFILKLNTVFTVEKYSWFNIHVYIARHK